MLIGLLCAKKGRMNLVGVIGFSKFKSKKKRLDNQTRLLTFFMSEKYHTILENPTPYSPQRNGQTIQKKEIIQFYWDALCAKEDSTRMSRRFFYGLLSAKKVT